jgi:hypothetical protein
MINPLTCKTDVIMLFHDGSARQTSRVRWGRLQAKSLSETLAERVPKDLEKGLGHWTYSPRTLANRIKPSIIPCRMWSREISAVDWIDNVLVLQRTEAIPETKPGFTASAIGRTGIDNLLLAHACIS